MSEEEKTVELLEKEIKPDAPVIIDNDNDNDSKNDSKNVEDSKNVDDSTLEDTIPKNIIDSINEYLSGNDDNPNVKFLIKSNQPKEPINVDNKVDNNDKNDIKLKQTDGTDEKNVHNKVDDDFDKLNIPTEMDLIAVNRTKISEEFKACYVAKNLNNTIVKNFIQFNNFIIDCEKSSQEIKKEWNATKKRIRKIRKFSKSRHLTLVYRALNVIVEKL